MVLIIWDKRRLYCHEEKFSSNCPILVEENANTFLYALNTTLERLALNHAVVKRTKLVHIHGYVRNIYKSNMATYIRIS